ncbi:hypothetical protein ABTL16_19495, partial [Acinetobacter baumannii]
GLGEQRGGRRMIGHPRAFSGMLARVLPVDHARSSRRPSKSWDRYRLKGQPRKRRQLALG